MAGFRKAKAEQAALKVGIFGPPGSGKTFTTLLLAEGLAKQSGKRIAYVDTERGTDFYCQRVPDRAVHPDAFDFDALYTRSLSEIIASVRSLQTEEYGVVVIDSVTHLWEAARAAYQGRMTGAGTIPMHAWGKIKKPYKDLMSFLLSSPMHVFILGRQGVEYETDEETDELKAVGYKMKAEGETAYEPHVLIRMEASRPKKSGEIGVAHAYIEKDRTGVLAGRTFINPNFDSLCRPLLGLLGGTQAKMDNGDDAAAIDAEKFAQQDKEREVKSAEHRREFLARIALCKTEAELKKVGESITTQVKSDMTPQDLAEVREAYGTRNAEVSRAGAQHTTPED